MDHGQCVQGRARHLVARLSDLGVDFQHWCFACGRLNDAGLHLDFDVSRDRAETRFTPQRGHEGYDGTVHGGILTALLDETMGWAIFHQGIWGVTARIAVTFRQPVKVGAELRVVGGVARMPSRATETRGTASRDYSMRVSVARALPDVRDGLKPVQRRILYGMHEMGLRSDRPYRKSAAIVGEVMGKYHPHGDAPIYDALVRLAQDFAARYPLIQGQGNFGCFSGDTKVELYNGEQKTLAELVDMAHRGARVDVFTVDAHRNVRIKPMRAPRLVRRNDPVVKVTLESGAEIVCTPDHRFMLRDGTYRDAQQLKPKDQLMPFARSSIPERLHRTGAFPIPASLAQKVAKVEPAGRADVYDLTVDITGNFALAAGIFVHNSIDDDPPGAPRYTEARLAAVSAEL